MYHSHLSLQNKSLAFELGYYQDNPFYFLVTECSVLVRVGPRWSALVRVAPCCSVLLHILRCSMSLRHLCPPITCKKIPISEYHLT